MMKNYGTISATESIPGSNSQQGLVAVSSRAATYKRTSGIHRRLMALLLLLAFIVFALIIALAIVSYYYSQSPPVTCNSKDCIRAAANLVQSMDTSVEPCEDFYQFACGRWSETHPMPDSAINHDWFADRGEYMIRKIRGFFRQEVSDDEPIPVLQARIMYYACMDIEKLDSLGLGPMMEVLSNIGIPLPIANPSASTSKFKLIATIVNAKLTMDKELLIGFGVYPDSKNRSINRITIGKPETDSPLPSYHDLDKRIEEHRRRLVRSSFAEATSSGTSTILSAYIRYMTRVMKYSLIWNSTRPVSFSHLDVQLTLAAIEVQLLETKIYRLLYPEQSDELEPNYMTLSELQNLTNKASNGTSQLDWREFFTEIFNDVENVTLDLDGKDVIVVLNVKYLEGLMALLSSTDKVTLHNYLWWQIVDTLSPHMNRYMRDLKQHYLEEVTDGNMPLARSLFCASGVNHMMGMAVSYFIADPEFLRSTKNKVEEMLSDVEWAFNKLVDQLDWMDASTKKATREKAAATNSLIGYPTWLLEPGALEQYYEGVSVEHETYLANMLDIRQLMIYTMLNSLRTINEVAGSSAWVTDPTDVNAFHTFQANAITVPIGILQFPFYELGLEALNYGAIGSILGHELTHGFDDQGRQFDMDGNLRQWWSSETVQEYVNKIQCFVKQYNGYRLEAVNSTVDGKLTLGENIADNGGLREALRAYRHFKARSGREPKLPGLEKYSDEQLFFLSFANLWCETYTKQSLKIDLTDGHSPNHVRVWGSLANSPEFARVWNCPVGSFMNPSKDKCIIW